MSFAVAAAFKLSALAPKAFSRSSSILRAKSGHLLAIIGRVSAHEAQYAAGLVRTAGLSPKPPLRSGSVAVAAALLFLSIAKCSLPSKVHSVDYMPASWLFA